MAAKKCLTDLLVHGEYGDEVFWRGVNEGFDGLPIRSDFDLTFNQQIKYERGRVFGTLCRTHGTKKTYTQFQSYKATRDII
ncbi:hypothetical protein EVB91_039 [Rhizobium phage RHph_I1_18]|nr:hypothetical protein EVB91_039 [Rhizobium phage RHph_I1_18]